MLNFAKQVQYKLFNMFYLYLFMPAGTNYNVAAFT